MFCSNCGKEIENGIKFCPFCGKKIVDGNDDNYSETKNIPEKIDYSSINLQYSNLKKSQWVAYLLWLLGGTTGAHRFYSGNYIYCAVFLVLSIMSLFSREMFALIVILLLIDLFILHLSISEYNKNLLEQLKQSQTDNTFINISSSGCLPAAAYTIVTGILYWMFFTANFMVHLKNIL